MRHAVIAGAGIAGLAAAAGLGRSGWRVTVVEQSQEVRALGTGILLEPNAVSALAELGVRTELDPFSVRYGAAGIKNSRGRWLVRGSVADIDSRFHSATTALPRADLLRVLHDHASAQPNFELLLATSAARTEGPDNASLVVIDQDGRERRIQADLIIAADGLRSTLRQAVLPGLSAPEYAGYVTWRGIGDFRGPASEIVEYWGAGARVGLIPLKEAGTYWYFTETLPEGSSSDRHVPDIVARLDRWPDEIQATVRSTPDDRLIRSDIYHLTDPPRTYAHGRLVFLGDAAHAMTPDLGQGAAQSLEDAAWLTRMVREDSADLDLAARQFDQARRPRASSIAKLSARVGRVGQWQSPLLTATRNALAAVTPDRVIQRSLDRVVAWNTPSTEFR